MSQSWKKSCHNGGTHKSGHFRSFWPAFGQAQIFSRKLLMVPQLYAKYEKKLMSQSWKKGCRIVETHKSRHFEPNLNRAIFGPILGERKFSQKISAPSVLSTYDPMPNITKKKKRISPEKNVVKASKQINWGNFKPIRPLSGKQEFS